MIAVGLCDIAVPLGRVLGGKSMPRNIILLTCIIMTPLTPSATTYADDTAGRDVAAVQKLLKKQFPGDTWGRGPTRLNSRAIDTAYPHSRFYYVFSPQYPVAREGQVPAVVQIDGKDELRLVQKPGDYNQGLLAIRNADDAKTAAAAIMSLMLGPMGPREVSPDDVEVAAAGQGWRATAGKRPGRWKVEFDGKGQCTAASYKHLGPLPICIGGHFRVVNMPQGSRVNDQAARVGLFVDSVEPNSIAQRAGLQASDLVVGFDGRPLPNDDTIQKMRQTVYTLKQQRGISRSLTVLRGGRNLTLILTW
jgi:hypothetical protein